MDVVKERLVQFAKSQGLMMMDFYKKITYPELSADWLLLGKRGDFAKKQS